MHKNRFESCFVQLIYLLLFVSMMLIIVLLLITLNDFIVAWLLEMQGGYVDVYIL